MKKIGYCMFTDGVVGTIGATMVHLMGESVPQEFGTVLIGIMLLGLSFMVISDLLEERRARSS